MLLSTCDHFEKRQEGRNIRDNASGNANNQIQSKDAEQKKSQDNSRCLDSNQIDTEVNKMDNTVNTYQDANKNRPQQQNSIHGHLLQCYSTTCRKETNSSCYSTECRNKQNNEPNVGITTQGDGIDLMHSKDAEDDKPQQNYGHLKSDEVDMETSIKDEKMNAYHEDDPIIPEKQNFV